MSYEVRTDLQWNGQDVKIRGKRVVNKTAFETGLIVEGQAKVLAAVKTGRFRGSITTQSATEGTAVESPATAADKIAPPRDPQEVFVGTAVDYGPHLEFGTVNSDAQPSLRPALDLAKGQVLSIGLKNGRIEFRDYLK